ncbi:MAG TPA: hypothetical protein VIK33_17505 [Anaerolineae bacterium]
MTDRFAIVVILFIAVAVLAVGALAGDAYVRSRPAVIEAVAAREMAIAEQEQARAEQERARAAAERSQAAEAQTRADALRAALPSLTLSFRFVAIGIGTGLAVLLIGGSLAAVCWFNVRARVIYPNSAGQWPIVIERKFGGALWLVDTARGLGPVTQVDCDQATMPLPASEATALQIATQAQAATAMIGIARQSDTPAERIAERVKAAAENLPAPTFANAADGGMQMVYVKQPGNSKAAREKQDLEQFIRLGWGARGLSRRAWVPSVFTKTGNRCTRGYYESIMETLEKAGLAAKDESGAWSAVVDMDEALDAFGLAHEVEDGRG